MQQKEQSVGIINEAVGCKAKRHNRDCPCLKCRTPRDDCRECSNLTEQHKVPKKIALDILNWSWEEIHAKSNKQKLSFLCHRDADKKLPKLYQRLLRKHKAGKMVTVRDVLFYR